MRGCWRSLLFAGVLLTGAAPVRALSGEEMYRYCASNACGGYFLGAFDGVRIAGAVGDARLRKLTTICPPAHIDNGTVVQVALDYLERHPRTRYLSAANLALRAWRERWPCGGED